MQMTQHTTLELDLRELPAPAATRLTELGFSVRTLHRVVRAYACRYRLDPREALVQMTVHDLATLTLDDLQAVRGFGAQSFAEVREKLARCGLALRGGYAGGLW